MDCGIRFLLFCSIKFERKGVSIAEQLKVLSSNRVCYEKKKDFWIFEPLFSAFLVRDTPYRLAHVQNDTFLRYD